MKILFPVNNSDTEKYNIQEGFANAEWVCVYDCEAKKYQWTTSEEISREEGNLSLELKLMGIYTVICFSIPLLALDLFTESGLKVYRAGSEDVRENIKMLEQDSLLLLTTDQLHSFQSCSSSCGTCSTSCK